MCLACLFIHDQTSVFIVKMRLYHSASSGAGRWVQLCGWSARTRGDSTLDSMSARAWWIWREGVRGRR